MAPRRSSGGGYHGGSSSNTCPGAFSYWTSQANLAYYILFLIMYIGISFGLCIVRKRSGPGKRLIGVVYIFALLFAIISLALDLVNLVLSECEVSLPTDYDNVSIASTVLYHLSCLGLLFVVLYKLNSMLRSRLGSVVTTVRVILLAIFGIMAAVYIAYIALSGYLWSNDLYYYRNEADGLVDSTQKLSMAVRSLYLICVLVSTVLAITTVSSLRRAHISGGDLLGWIITLHLFMIIWAVLAVVIPALTTYSKLDVSPVTSFALAYILTFFQALSFIALLAIAKHASWGQDAAAMHHQPQVYAPVQTAYDPHYQSEFVGHAK
ncbi:uncharacterized protein yc1106_02543 [Curvularia clavata]|uniref:Uncharacterized protein n=1 Tax=Curvularia clavata TaxID=95742 RepID=A0A9Q8Z3E9_CURCL|nr:uncharacterized protein yc1106_02543 [Curvularia clavata]